LVISGFGDLAPNREITKSNHQITKSPNHQVLKWQNGSVSFDVAVAGAGPAGAWTAYRLARHGARVAILDGSHPREKPCGGGVTARALELVADARLFPGEVFVRAATFEQADRSTTVPLPDKALAIVSRASFDRALLDAALNAGAELVPERVVDAGANADGAWVRTTRRRLTSAWIVGADGAAGLVRRRVWRPFRRDQISIATGYFAHGVSSNEITVRFTEHPPGYAWSFPRADHLAIGICAQADAASAGALRHGTRRWIERTGLAKDATLTPYSWPIPSLSERDVAAERASGPRWMLVGDAAGLVDPITREGIFFALQSADAAAAAIAGGANPARRYDAALGRLVYPELARAARLKARFFEPRFLRLLVDALRRPSIAAIMADLVAGRQTYHGLRRRLMRTMELGLAWQLFVREHKPERVPALP
jgi:geranylgeranyl reductase family protein